MNDLKNLLDLAADGRAHDPVDGADLARAHQGSRQRRRRYSTGLAALSLVTVAGVGGVIAAGSGPGGLAGPGGSDVTAAPATTPVRLVAQPLEAAPYTFDLTPQGWSVQGNTPTAVTIAPDDGSTTTDVDDFRGKLTILFDSNALTGEQVSRGGREFWIGSSAGYTLMATRTLPGEPEGVVRIQFPDAAGWTRETMLWFLGSVHVGAAAEQGVG